MTKFIIDTSVVIKWVVEETDSVEAERLFGLLKNGKIILFAPTLLLIELINILYWKNKYTQVEIKKIVTKIHESGINFIDFTKAEIGEILNTVLENKITSYDAIFLNLAMSTGTKLISADKQLLLLSDRVVSSSQSLTLV